MSDLSCGHNEYWMGHYGTCMACKAEKAESELATLRGELAYSKAKFESFQKLFRGKVDICRFCEKTTKERDQWKAKAEMLYQTACNEHFRHRCDARKPCSLCLLLDTYNSATKENAK